jgi:hypothetical protein
MGEWNDVDLYTDSWARVRPWTNLEQFLLLLVLLALVLWVSAIDWDSARVAWDSFWFRYN